MADESLQPSADSISAAEPNGPSATRKYVASIVQIAFLIVFGAVGYFGIWALRLFDVVEQSTGALDVALTVGGLVVGVIVGGILGSKIKQAMLR